MQKGYVVEYQSDDVCAGRGSQLLLLSTNYTTLSSVDLLILDYLGDPSSIDCVKGLSYWRNETSLFACCGVGRDREKAHILHIVVNDHIRI
jgi:hypothetical protein